MARIRTIKPEFWTSEQVVECSPTARLLFVGMWNFCDDGGNHTASLRQLKMEVFAGDDFTQADMAKFVTELIDNDLLIEYQAIDGKKYWHVTGWKHQKIDKPNIKYPKFGDHSATIRRPFGDHSTTEGIGEYSIGEDSKVVDSISAQNLNFSADKDSLSETDKQKRFDSIKHELKESGSWIESVCIATRRSELDIIGLIEEFLNNLKADDDYFKSLTEIKKHFRNWVNKREQKPPEIVKKIPII